MGGDQPQTNGSDPIENCVNGTEDVEMGDDAANGPRSPKQDRDGDGDEEMTVVVPPSKGPRLSGEPDQERPEVTMDGIEEDDSKKSEGEIDPREKTVSGTVLLSCRVLLEVDMAPWLTAWWNF
jgi:26S proteasome regulatory subunit N3